MPAAGGIVAAGGERTASTIGGGEPVARIGSVGIPTVEIIGCIDIADEVVARQHIAALANRQQVSVVKADTGVKHGNHDIRAAQCQIPGPLGIDCRGGGSRRRSQIPLAHRRAAAAASQIQGVIRNRQQAPALVDHRIFDIRLTGQPGRQIA